MQSEPHLATGVVRATVLYAGLPHICVSWKNSLNTCTECFSYMLILRTYGLSENARKKPKYIYHALCLNNDSALKDLVYAADIQLTFNTYREVLVSISLLIYLQHLLVFIRSWRKAPHLFALWWWRMLSFKLISLRTGVVTPIAETTKRNQRAARSPRTQLQLYHTLEVAPKLYLRPDSSAVNTGRLNRALRAREISCARVRLQSHKHADWAQAERKTEIQAQGVWQFVIPRFTILQRVFFQSCVFP